MCVPSDFPIVIYFFLVPIIAMELMLLGLTLAKANFRMPHAFEIRGSISDTIVGDTTSCLVG